MTAEPANPLSRDLLLPTASVLAEALADDPAYAFVFPDATRRRASLERFFSLHLSNHVPHGCTFVRGPCEVDAEGPVTATVTVRPPGGIKVSKVRQARSIAQFTLGAGPAALRRLLRIARIYEALERSAAGGKPYVHVHMMAVAPRLQGRGIGAALLSEALGRCASAQAPVVLTTHKAANVRFYERAGFRVAEEHRIAPGGRDYTVWAMRRDARPLSAQPTARI
jgi:GNAT superfamily N-acetyltransferase